MFSKKIKYASVRHTIIFINMFCFTKNLSSKISETLLVECTRNFVNYR